jgi:hypothetical protein
MGKFKVAILFLLCTLSSFSRGQDHKSFSWKSPDLSKLAYSPSNISKKLFTDCIRQFGLTEIDSCKRGARRMKVILKSGEGNAESAYMLFREQGQQLLVKSEAKKMLDLIKPFLSTGQFDLWRLTLKFFPKEREAITVLALLFQDTSPQKLHIQQLKDMNPDDSHLQEIVDHLDKSIETLSNLRGEENWRRSKNKYRFYPSELDHLLVGASFYHFYIPAFMATELLEEGASPLVASFYSGFFNY